MTRWAKTHGIEQHCRQLQTIACFPISLAPNILNVPQNVTCIQCSGAWKWLPFFRWIAYTIYPMVRSLRWRHNGRDSVSNHQPHDCLLNRWFIRRSKKISKPRVTGLCVGNSPGTGEYPAQMATNAENVSIWWRHHVISDTATARKTLSQ